MEQVIELYGKTYHFWQVDRGDLVPMGAPELMMSFTQDAQMNHGREQWEERDKRYGVSSQQKAEKRAYIPEPETHLGKSKYNYDRP
jgi:hypothetical protein